MAFKKPVDEQDFVFRSFDCYKAFILLSGNGCLSEGNTIVKAYSEPNTFLGVTEYKQLLHIVCQWVFKRTFPGFEFRVSCSSLRLVAPPPKKKRKRKETKMPYYFAVLFYLFIFLTSFKIVFISFSCFTLLAFKNPVDEQDFVFRSFDSHKMVISLQDGYTSIGNTVVWGFCHVPSTIASSVHTLLNTFPSTLAYLNTILLFEHFFKVATFCTFIFAAMLRHVEPLTMCWLSTQCVIPWFPCNPPPHVDCPHSVPHCDFHATPATCRLSAQCAIPWFSCNFHNCKW